MSGASRGLPLPEAEWDLAPILVGSAAGANLDAHRLAVYQRIVDVLYQGLTFAGDPSARVQTIHPSDAIAVDEDITHALRASLDPSRLTLLDLTGLSTARGVGQSLVAQGISDAFELSHAPLLVLVDEALDDQDALQSVLQTHPSHIEIVARRGHDLFERAGAGADRLKQALVQLGQDPLRSLRLKLIRTSGWYEREHEGQRVFARNWYDASFGENEITALLLDYLNGIDVQAVVIGRTASTWVEAPAKAAATTLGIPWCYDDGASLAALAERQDPMNVALAFPIVDSGATVTKSYERVVSVPYIRTAHLVSVLSTEGYEDQQGLRSLDIGADATYFLKVSQSIVTEAHLDEYPLYPGRTSPPYDGRDKELSVFEFWDLVHQAGTRDEDQVPSYRVSLGAVPHMTSMLTGYGAWLASRLMNLVRRELALNSPAQVAVLAPAEANTLILTRNLRALYGVPVIRVPRRRWLTREVADMDATQMGQLLANEDTVPWVRALAQLPKHTRMVVVDEFAHRGTTIEALMAIARGAGFASATRGFTLIDMRPSHEEHGRKLAISSLYRLPRKGSA